MISSRLLLLLLIGAGSQAWAQPPRAITIPRVNRPPKLQDFLNNRPRENEAAIRTFTQTSPGDGIPVTESTVAYLSYDDLNLYAVFVCEAPPGELRARYSHREDLYPDDFVGIQLDTWLDGQRSYYFYVNARGIQRDGIHTEGGDDDDGWDTLWQSEARISADQTRFVALIAIPFKSLRFSNAEKQTWGILLQRQIPRKSETAGWPYIDSKDSGFVRQFARLEGLEGISPGRNLQFIPYMTGTRSSVQPPEGGNREQTLQGRVGLDGKAVLRDTLTLDYTLNPDFSQVESDEPQVTINQRFEVQFPERRPFFLENAGFFQTRQQLFFSRRIADPEFGARLTGKIGRWALGALTTDDRLNGSIIGVGRVKREFGTDSNVAVLFAERDSGASSNRVVSADTRVRLTTNTTLSGQASISSTRDSNGGLTSGFDFYAAVERTGRHFNSTTQYEDISPGFKAALGFVPRTDVRRVTSENGYMFRRDSGTLLAFGPFMKALTNWDRTGRLVDAQVETGMDFILIGSTEIGVAHSESFEYFKGAGFRLRGDGVGFSSEYWKRLGLTGGFNRDTAINYFPAAGLAPFRGESLKGNAGVTWRPGQRLRFANSYLYTRLARGPAVVFTNHIARSKVYYQFNREFSLRLTLDYSAVLADTRLASEEPAKRFNTDLLVTWLLNPGTAVYFGYSDLRENRLLFRPGFTGGSPDLNTGRQVFVKLSYLIRR